MAILILATLLSPFLPLGYAAIPPLWLLTLMAARLAPTVRILAIVAILWMGLNVYWPTDWPVAPSLLGLAVLVPQAVMVGLAVVAMRRPRADVRHAG
jgi:hypothetical protein